MSSAPGNVGPATPSALSCPSATCGGNSPVVNGFPINGFREGCKNSEGIRLAPDSLEMPGDKCNDHELTVDDAELIAIGTDTCRGRTLEGATFKVELYEASATVPFSTESIRIAEVAFTNQRDGQKPFFAYSMTLADGTNLCSRAGAKTWRKKLRLGEHDDPPIDDAPDDVKLNFFSVKATEQALAKAGFPADAFAAKEAFLVPSKTKKEELAIVYKGEVYNHALAVLAQPDAGWFNIVCLRDSLAKIDLLELAPAQAATGPGIDTYISERKAALRMLTADYCGTAHYTARGTELHFKPIRPFSSDGKKIEAVWGPTGALCLSSIRALWRDWDGKPISEKLMPPRCQKETHRCKGGAKWLQELRKHCQSDGEPHRRIEPCHDYSNEEEGAHFFSYRR